MEDDRSDLLDLPVAGLAGDLFDSVLLGSIAKAI
jgi:hypothetical protein